MMVASNNTADPTAEDVELARRVSIVTEFDLATQDRLDFSGFAFLLVDDAAAGRWIKQLIVQAIDSARTDERVEL